MIIQAACAVLFHLIWIVFKSVCRQSHITHITINTVFLFNEIHFQNVFQKSLLDVLEILFSVTFKNKEKWDTQETCQNVDKTTPI